MRVRVREEGQGKGSGSKASPTHALFPVSTAPSATPIPSYTPASALVRVRG